MKEAAESISTSAMKVVERRKKVKIFKKKLVKLNFIQ